jgi:hypothetical protein
VVTGSGADVWDRSDKFRFVYQKLAGDGSIVSQVTAMDDVHDWAKAGVMMRETLNADSRYAYMLVSPGRGLAFQRRTKPAGSAVHTDAGSGRDPSYVKLTRAGNTFTAYRSADGATGSGSAASRSRWHPPFTSGSRCRATWIACWPAPPSSTRR